MPVLYAWASNVTRSTVTEEILNVKLHFCPLWFIWTATHISITFIKSVDRKNKLADFATLEKKLGKPINMVLMDDNIFTFMRVMLCLSYPKTQFLKMRSLQDYKRYKIIL